MNEFGFKVLRRKRSPVAQALGATDPGWAVRLRGVGEWPNYSDVDIAGDEFWGIAHTEAVAALEQFIAEAQEALAKLKAQQEMGGES